jgi:hypothetical protein
MKLLSDAQRARLILNNSEREADHVPVVKLFVPWGQGTWLFTEMEPDGRLFGLCDLGSPELGYADLDEIEAVRGPHGLRIERDLHFHTDKPLSLWTAAARAAGRIVDPD